MSADLVVTLHAPHGVARAPQKPPPRVRSPVAVRLDVEAWAAVTARAADVDEPTVRRVLDAFASVYIPGEDPEEVLPGSE